MKYVFSIIVIVSGMFIFPVLAQDLSSGDAIIKALNNNLGIRIARLNVESSEINNSWGAAGALPQIGTTVAVSTFVSDQTENPTSFIQDRLETTGLNSAINLSTTLFDGFGMFVAKHNLELLVSQSEGSATLIIETTIQGIYQAYFSVVVEEELLEVLAKSMALSRERLDDVLWRESIGVSGTFDRLQFQNAIIADSSSWLQQGMAVRAATRNLNRLMGEEESKVWHLTSELKAPPLIDNISFLKQKVLSDNRSLQNARISHRIAEQGIKQAESMMYPVLGLGTSFGDARNSYTAGELYGEGRTVNTSAQLTLNFNLFNGGATRRAIAQAKIQENIAGITEEQQILDVSSFIDDAYDRFQVLSKVYSLSVQSSSNSVTSLEIGESSYKDGVINSLDYRALEIASQRSQVKELQALQAWYLSFIEIQKLVGSIQVHLIEE